MTSSQPQPTQTHTRVAGVVLHITSLPGPHGCGDLGAEAHRFVGWLASAGHSVWQLLPLSPAGPGDSPYQSPSAFAGNPLLVALQPLVDAGWLQAIVPPAWAAADEPIARRVDYASTTAFRWQHLQAAAAGFFARATRADRLLFDTWCAHPAQAAWLPEWCLFAAIKDAHGGQPWWLWAADLAARQPAALQQARQQHAEQIATHAFVQWCFDTQLARLRAAANDLGVRLMGDVPIFVAHDSADVWARPELYCLDEVTHQPLEVAGVPPDGYSPDGQRWGNPLYRWDRMAVDDFAWWVARAQRAAAQTDLFRIDHFRGFAACWQIPASCAVAAGGRWVAAPGVALFTAIQAALASDGAPLPIVAEDLGHITPDVLALRDQFGLPGMCIVQEAFQGNTDHLFLPHNHRPNMLAYSSTHDSDTALGWWQHTTVAQQTYASSYLRCQADGSDIAWAVVQAAYTSVARMALAPLQDLLGLGSAHRMNLPGTAQGNWGWRFSWGMVPADLAPRLLHLAKITGRLAAA
jgi:4-alpha-glucanotransferase